MKLLAILFTFLLLGKSSSAQISTSKIDFLLDKKSAVVKMSGRKISSHNNMTIDRIMVEDLISKQKASGLSFSVTKVKDRIGYIDEDEIPALIKFFEIVRDADLKTFAGQILTLKSKGGVDFEFISSKGEPIITITIDDAVYMTSIKTDILYIFSSIQK